MLKTLEWTGSALRLVEQTRLPNEIVYVDITTPETMHDAIKRLVVRGAPAIGIAAAFGVYLGVRGSTPQSFPADLQRVCTYLATARPTAVNLFWAIERIRRIGTSPDRILQECLAMIDEDNAVCRAIGQHGLDLLRSHTRPDNTVNLITHCNAGGLATAQFGTALAPIYVGQEQGVRFHVFVDETRPLLQGARITAMELMQNGCDCTLVCDNMSAAVFSRFKVDAVIVGTDRVAANGDVANKIGTHNLAIIARRFNVPFYVAAPLSSIDVTLATGAQIPIEERKAEEITCGFGKRTAPEGVKSFNPAFDVTPNELVTALITEKGVLKAPYTQTIAAAMARR
jgi:methylthioribose-1-phosphate isomerase